MSKNYKELKEIIDGIRAKVNIVDVIGEFLTVTPVGKNYKAYCPFHQDGCPSLFISSSKQVYNCFICSERGNVFDFLKRKTNMDIYESIRWLCGKYSIEVPEIVKDHLRRATARELEIIEKQSL